MSRTLGPIWEANHMWLIIVIVILFTGFPDIYSSVSTYLHIPLLIMLMGIIARGTAFAFRHYDAVEDYMQLVYNKVFRYSSFITPFFLGMIAASTVSGTIDPNATNFMDAYIFSWLHFFSVSVGLFTICICGYLACHFFNWGNRTAGRETKIYHQGAVDEYRRHFFRGTGISCRTIDHVPLITWLFGNPVGIISISAALISLVIQWILIGARNKIIIRFLAGIQVTMILVQRLSFIIPVLFYFQAKNIFHLWSIMAMKRQSFPGAGIADRKCIYPARSILSHL